MEATRHIARLPTYGNGWPGSTASGVSTGSTVRRKYSSRNRSCSPLRSLGRISTMPSAASSGWISCRKQRCCSSTSWWIRAATAAIVSAAVRSSGPEVGSPACIRRLSVATRIMKNSSRFELKMDRNFTRSSSGTVGSWASSSTRRLKSSHDSSRLRNAFEFMSAPAVEGLVQQNAVAHAARAHDQRQIAAEDHQLLDRDRPGQDDVRPLRLEPANLAPLARREPLQPLPDRGHVRLGQPQAVAILALTTQVD